jgi:ribosomal protein S18 acetylase RimI-like enzyme
MTEFERAFALMDRLDERSAERLEPTPFGPVLVHERLDRVHDLNFLRAERPGGASAEELAAATERVQGAAGIRHRRVNLRSEEERRRLEACFIAIGWEPQHFLLMAHRGEVGRRPGLDAVREVDEPALRALWAAGIRAEPYGKNEEVVQQLLEHKRVIEAAIPTRFFAAGIDGELVSHAELYSEDGVGQIENVVTLPEFRGRGLASAVVARAVRESQAAGNDLTFLVADADDWPQRLYERLGFEAIGRYGRFLRKSV